ncbi:translation initiation factor IF-2 [uncultured Cohaesibacter sp.]|uniref:translation initiation factor IF-2 n=1 Tax=uncultured Cohaesibacter sp. TaxID=1002546 RepID=UPI0029313702|nr:translation initiation factor IF-2 [uncultured Cohaesibacter sp.]
MSNENSSDNNSPSEKKTLSLGKNVGQGTVRQSFSHGRSKAVVVEKRKRRFTAPGDAKPAAAGKPAASEDAKPSQPSAPAQARTNDQKSGGQGQNQGKGAGGKGQRQRNRGGGGQAGGNGNSQRNLTSSENAKRLQALEAAKMRAREMEVRKKEEEAKRKEAEARRKLEEEAKRKEAEALAAQKAAEEAEAKKKEAERKAQEEADAAAAKEKEDAKPKGQRTTERPQRDDRDGERQARGGDRGGEQRQARGDRPQRGGDRPQRNDDREQRGGERQARGDRPQRGGDRPPRSGDRPPRSGDRPPRSGTGAGRPGGANFSEAPDPNAEGKPGAKKIIPVPKRVRPDEPAKAQPAKPRTDERRRGKLTLSNALNAEEQRERSLASMRRRRAKQKGNVRQEQREKVFREVVIPETITVQELAQRMTERAVDVIKILMKQGMMVKTVDVLDADTAQLVAEELGHTVKRVAASDVEEGLFDKQDSEDSLLPRPPVVTIMGHVDHGKTSLLDAVRHANVVKGEAGGITQHIGAYQVEQSGQKITFIDTPGHAAFTEMRARGAKSTDIVVLVVAADDGVMPQTIEAINHARAAEVPIIVAVNKIDLPAADPTRVRNELLQHEVFVETMGGEVLEVEVSAKEKINLDGLLEAILMQSEMLELKSNPDREADGIVVEAKLDKGRGPVATVLVQNGTLKVGDIVVAGEQWGKVRALIDDLGDKTETAEPSKPVEILGFDAAPNAGDPFVVVETEGRAREITDYRIHKNKELAAAKASKGSLEQMLSNLKEAGDVQTFPLVIKGDVKGSVEAIIGALDGIGNEEVSAQVLHSGVGGVSESDVTLASASGAPIIAFNVRANAQAKQAAEQKGVEIRYYNIIYDLTDDVKAAMSGMLSPEVRETFIGYAEILEVFNISKVGKVAGCRVTEGVVERGTGVRLLRDNVVIHTGKLSTLKRFKDEVKEVNVGQECGMAFENYQDLRAGDQIECFRVEEIARTL